jgi:4-amino-4-deoxy-L-arabinose transferase-like glycosyltransferase
MTALAIVAASGLVRLGLASIVPLVPDEAYYWEWSRRLAPGYFDHPPLIAILIAAGSTAFGDTPLGVRFFPVLCGTVAMGLVAALARRLGGGTAAIRAAVISTVVPLSAVGLVLATPDAPLLLALAATLFAIDRALEKPAWSSAATAWWMAAGLAAGAGLSAKYSAALLPLGVLVAMLASRALAPRMAAPGPYLAGAAAIVVFLPVVIWNAHRDWISFAFQLDHGFGAGSGSVLGRQLELFAGQLGLVTPILFVLIAVVSASSLRRTEPRRFLLAVVAVTTFAVFVYSAMHSRVQPNWPAPAYVPGFVLLAIHAGGRRWRAWRVGGIALAALATALLSLHTIRPVLPLNSADDPVAQAFGWAALADSVAIEASGVAGSAAAVWIAANRYQEAAQLAFHLPRNPTVFSLNLDARPNQYDLWLGFTELASPGDALVLVLRDTEWDDQVIERVRPHFRQIRSGARVAIGRGAEHHEIRRVWLLSGWRGSWVE